jgi:hypothetical protein
MIVGFLNGQYLSNKKSMIYTQKIFVYIINVHHYEENNMHGQILILEIKIGESN